jgi:hypothetical protein
MKQNLAVKLLLFVQKLKQIKERHFLSFFLMFFFCNLLLFRLSICVRTVWNRLFEFRIVGGGGGGDDVVE